MSLNHIDLSVDDKEIVVEGKQLTDKHINYAQAILKKLFDWLSGLHSTLILWKLANALASNDVVQLIHSRTNHWIVASTIGCSTGKVLVFDSSIDQATTNLIQKLFGADIQVKLEVTSRQQESLDYD